MRLLFSFLTFSSLLVALIAPQSAQAIVKVHAVSPVTLTIPRLKVSAPIETRGLNARKEMRPPSGSASVAWYNAGTVPGQPGDAVIYGHLTDQHFGPAVFSRLNKLHVNDKITVRDAHRTVHTFVVTKLDTFRWDSMTFAQLSQPTKFIHLNLYTCAGHWVPAGHHYSHYLVVYTKLVSSRPAK